MQHTYTLKPKKTQKLYRNVRNEDTILFKDYSPSSEIIKYNSFFFRSDILIEYVKKINTIFKKNGKQSLFKENYKLYNMDDIVYHLLNKPGVRTRNYNRIIQSDKWQTIKKYIISLIPSVLSKMCSKNVNRGYTKSSFNRNIKKLISEEASHIYDDDIVIMAPREIEHYISYEKIKKKVEETKKDDSDSDSDSDEEDYTLKRIYDIDEELDENIEEKLEDMDEEINEEFEEPEEPEEIIEKIDDYKKLKFSDYKEQFKEKLKMFVGFMIVSRGKCKIFPNDYILNLICTNMPGVGSILIGLYLYTILKHPILPMTGEDLLMTENLELSGDAIVYYDKIKKSKTFRKKYKNESKYGIHVFKRKFTTDDDLIPTNGLAILELANSYYNYPGLCLYEKIGFEYDKTLFSKNSDTFCVYDYGNLPMSLNFGDDAVSGCYAGLSIEEKITKILNIIVGNEQCSRNQICFIQNNSHKKLLSTLNELIVYQDSYMRFNYTSDYEIKINKKINKYTEILNIINQNKPYYEINYNYIKQIIHDLENNNITSDIEILLTHFTGGKKQNKTKKQKHNKIKNKKQNKTKKQNNK